MDKFEYILKALGKKAFLARLSRFANGIILVLIVALALLGLGMGLSFLLPVTGPIFFFFSLLAWVLVLASLLLAILAFLRPFDGERAAIVMESRYPDLNSELISALQLGRRRRHFIAALGFSAGMIDALGEKVSRGLPEMIRRPLADRRVLARNLLTLFLAVAAGGAFSAFLGSDFRRIVSIMSDPLGEHPFAGPGLEVSPGDVRLLEGDPLEVKAVIKGGAAGALYLEVKPLGREGRPDSLLMERLTPASHAKTLDRVVESLSYRVVHPKVSSPWFAARISPVPRAGDLNLTLTYPPYAGLPPARQEGSGHIHCLKGTVVRWTAKANKTLSEASLRMGNGDIFPLSIAGGDNLEGEFVVTAGGRYRVILKDAEGFENRHPDEYDVNLLADEFPVVELVSPSEDLELDDAAMVDILFWARDDFGLTESALVYQLENGRGGRVKMPGGGQRRYFQTGYSWDVGSLGLEPGRQVAYHVEVADNDSISGPKIGVSQARSIRIKDSSAAHRDLAEMEKELLKDFTELLGDELELMDGMEEMKDRKSGTEEKYQSDLREMSADQSRATEKFGDNMKKMDEYLRRASEDTFADPASLYMKVLARQMLHKVMEGEWSEEKQLQDLAGEEDMPREERAAEMKWMAEEKEKRISSMEKAVNLLQEAGKYQNMEEAVKAQERMMDLQRDLMDKLNKMKGGLDKESAKELGNLLREIAEMFSRLAQALTSMPSDLPEEFMNADSMKNLPLNDLMGDLGKMAEALSRGDLDQARRMAEKLLKEMGELLNRLKEAAGRYQELTMKGIQDFRQKRMSELGRIIEEQKAVLQKTEVLENAVRPRFLQMKAREDEDFRRSVEKWASAVEEKVNVVREESFDGNIRLPMDYQVLRAFDRTLNQLRAAAAQGKRDEARAALDLLREGADDLKKRIAAADDQLAAKKAATADEAVLEVLREADEALRANPSDEDAAATPSEREALGIMAAGEKGIRERTERLAEAMKTLSEMFPMIGTELLGDLTAAAAFMGDAESKLAARLPGQAVPPEREALYRLMKAEEQASQAGGEMSKMGGLMQGGQGSEGEAGQLFGLLPGIIPMPAPDRGLNERGRMGVSVRNFKIPGSEEFEVPSVFREEIMESMKSGYPREFEKSIKDYYRSIAE